MRKIFFSILPALVLCSCIDDKGNYNYTTPPEPEVTIANEYSVYLDERLHITPVVEFDKPEDLSYDWQISDPDRMMEHRFSGPELDITFTLGTSLYSAMLTVTDQSNGMKYFYKFSIRGMTVFSRGIILLSSDNGRSKLAFIDEQGVIQDDIYATKNHEDLPDGPLQIVPLYNPDYTGGLYLGYWIITSDTDDPGVQIDVNSMMKIKTFRENFFTVPEGAIGASCFLPLRNGTMVGIVDKKFYAGRFEGYYKWPGYNYFSAPMLGNYQLAPCIAQAIDGTFVWGYDEVRKCLVACIPPAGMFFNSTWGAGPVGIFDPANVGWDLVTLLSCPSGFYLCGRDSGGVVREAWFISGGQMVVAALFNRAFGFAQHIRPDSKWIISNTGVVYFSSDDKIYRYNPMSQQIEALVAQLEGGNVSMLKFALTAPLTEDHTKLWVGTPGHLYQLDLTGTQGNDGQIIKDITGFAGAPADLYQKIITTTP